MKATINAVEGGVYQVPLSPPLEGFSDFISAWVVRSRPSFLVDVGPASTADQLLGALEASGVSRLDYILLTHIHLDHAGAIGHISHRFPMAKIVCHPSGIPHLVDPSRLWDGSRKVLGPIALGYGPPNPVPAERFESSQGFAVNGITAVPTPGHAPHHVSFATEDCLFAGEACGVWYRFSAGLDYMRPATPPKFFMNLALDSIDTLISQSPTRMVVGHFGMHENGRALLDRHREQLLFWENWIRDRRGDWTDAEAVRRCVDGLLDEDPLLRNPSQFPRPARERERYFLENSVRGFLGWVKNSEGGRGKDEQ